ncbi:hypothetical protein EMIT0196MI5_120042 [Pseudomonas sp. IT-196MI5]
MCRNIQSDEDETISSPSYKIRTAITGEKIREISKKSRIAISHPSPVTGGNTGGKFTTLLAAKPG